MANKLNIYFALESVSDTYGGPIRSISRLQEVVEKELINVNTYVIQASIAISLKEPSMTLKRVQSSWQALTKIIFRIFKRQKSLIVFNNQWTFYVQILAVFCFFCRIPYIWWVRGVPSSQDSLIKFLVWHCSQKWLIANSKYIICSSVKSMERIKLQLPKNKAKFIDIPNIINFPNTHEDPIIADTQFIKDKLKLNFLSVGRFHKSKRYLQLVENCPLTINDRSVRLTLIGYASENAYIQLIKDSAKQRGLEIVIKNDVSPEYLYQIHTMSDIFISLSNVENFGNAIADALAFGLPVVINNETDFWPNLECKNIFDCSDESLSVALENAVLYAKKHSITERRNNFKNFWKDYSYNKFKNLLIIFSSFNH
jgi:glycosyltransferase involved in cell wall biosynthesis